MMVMLISSYDGIQIYAAGILRVFTFMYIKDTLPSPLEERDKDVFYDND